MAPQHPFFRHHCWFVGSSIKPRSQIHILFDDKKLPTNNSFWLLARMVLKIVTNDVILPWRTFFAQFEKRNTINFLLLPIITLKVSLRITLKNVLRSFCLIILSVFLASAESAKQIFRQI